MTATTQPTPQPTQAEIVQRAEDLVGRVLQVFSDINWRGSAVTHNLTLLAAAQLLAAKCMGFYVRLNISWTAAAIQYRALFADADMVRLGLLNALTSYLALTDTDAPVDVMRLSVSATQSAPDTAEAMARLLAAFEILAQTRHVSREDKAAILVRAGVLAAQASAELSGDDVAISPGGEA